MSYSREFATVELLLNSGTAKTRGVDAFALSVIKMERQLRRLFTFSIFQFPCFTDASIPDLKAALAKERIFVEGFIKGFESIHPTSIEDLIGGEYARLHLALNPVTKHRNKIFHGQITGEELGREDLLRHVSNMQEWCRLLGEGADHYMGYQGFDGSFRKALNPGFVSGYKLTLADVPGYEALLRSLRR